MIKDQKDQKDPKDQKDKIKRIRFMQYRGFSPDEIIPLIKDTRND
ncbi:MULTISPECIES: RecX family transcriptional regulator [unclassified Colwellia]|nr:MULTISPECIES: RecX family transcriptional regulator [unclassified Colwellia]MBA6230782.1 RecX family transcriptional regulator [Colwellia sp. MB02u-7]MBA6234713.1 RecX family transcriptional regulator [Colwellia sp. MB02u-11]MBA6261717.1 RecX family transcriptional regulator [Colwellia sp. MB3u-41]MBA6305247.1 RecX family transcriptional regulator [Colwellia sp. MB02u-14]MBA6312997.1 RecX family transcriptional regulator [Colwellia sp. MB3u-64]